MNPAGCWGAEGAGFPREGVGICGHRGCGAAPTPAAASLPVSFCGFSSEDGSKILWTVTFAVLQRFPSLGYQGCWEGSAATSLAWLLPPAKLGTSNAAGWILSLLSCDRTAAIKLRAQGLSSYRLAKADSISVTNPAGTLQKPYCTAVLMGSSHSAVGIVQLGGPCSGDPGCSHLPGQGSSVLVASSWCLWTNGWTRFRLLLFGWTSCTLEGLSLVGSLRAGPSLAGPSKPSRCGHPWVS